jgi:hypothetical protein
VKTLPLAARPPFLKTSSTDMSEAADLITKLVVGSEIRIRLGTPVSMPAREGCLQLQAMHWVRNGREPDVMRASSQVAAACAAPSGSLPTEPVAPLPGVERSQVQADPVRVQGTRSRIQNRRAALLIGGATLAVTSIAVLFVGLPPYVATYKHEQPVRAALAPASAAQAPASQAQALPEPELVKVVATVYEPSAPALPLAPASGPQAEVPVPPQVVAAVAPPRPTAPTPAGETPGGARPSQAASHPSKRDEPPSPAVIVDDGPTQKAQVLTGQAAAQPSPAQAAPRPTPTDATPRAKLTATTQRDQPRAGRLLAITPDSKAAVFTNPKSGLPEQFKVGDQLPSGETIRTISQKDGHVMTTAKEYSLE